MSYQYPHPIRIYRLEESGETDDFGQPVDPVEITVLECLADVQDGVSERVLSRYGVDLDKAAVIYMPVEVTDVLFGDKIETPFGTGTVEGRRHLDNSLAARLA